MVPKIILLCPPVVQPRAEAPSPMCHIRIAMQNALILQKKGVWLCSTTVTAVYSSTAKIFVIEKKKSYNGGTVLIVETVA